MPITRNFKTTNLEFIYLENYILKCPGLLTNDSWIRNDQQDISLPTY